MDLFISISIWFAVVWCLLVYILVFISEYRGQIFLPVALVVGARELVHKRFTHRVKKFMATGLVYILSPAYTFVWSLILFIIYLFIKLIIRPAHCIRVTTLEKSID